MSNDQFTEEFKVFASAEPAAFRAMINGSIRETVDKDKIADLEIIREYFTNAEFKEYALARSARKLGIK